MSSPEECEVIRLNFAQLTKNLNPKEIIIDDDMRGEKLLTLNEHSDIETKTRPHPFLRFSVATGCSKHAPAAGRAVAVAVSIQMAPKSRDVNVEKLWLLLRRLFHPPQSFCLTGIRILLSFKIKTSQYI